MEQEEVWDKIARPWKEFRHYSVSHISEFLEGKSGKVLDLGCGSGRNFVKSDNLEFYGIDFSEKMIELARESGIAKEVKKGYADAVPYEDGFFDLVVFSAALHCVDSAEKRKKALSEVYRVLKKGGEALVSVWSRGQGRMKNRDKESFVPWSVPQLDSFGHQTGQVEKYERYTYIYDVDELVADLEDAGFVVKSAREGKNIVVVVEKG